MHILLLILKIIGGLLLFLLALLIFVILIVLLVPLRYRFILKKEEEGLPDGQLEAGWLFSLVNFHGSLGERGLHYRMKAGWVTLVDSGEEEDGKESEDWDFPDSFEEEAPDKPAAGEALPAEKEPAESPEAEKAETEEPPKEKEPAEPPEAEKAEAEESPTEKEPAESPEAEKAETEEPPKEEEPAEPPEEDLLDRISNKAEAFWSQVEKTADDVEEKIQMAEDFLSDFPPDVYVPIIIDTIYKIILHLFPQHLQGYIDYGFDDPHTTGKITSWTAAFYPLYAGSVEVTPDFTRSVLAGELEGRGRIRLGFLVRIVIGLLLRKEVRFAIGYFLKCRKKTRRPAKG